MKGCRAVMMKRLLPLLFLFAVLIPLSVQAQDDNWTMTLFMDMSMPSGYVLNVTPTTNQQIGDILHFPAASSSFKANNARLSPDGRYLAVTMWDQNTGVASPIFVADLHNNVCCFLFPPPINFLLAVDLGNFDPSSHLLAYSYVGSDVENGEQHGGIAVVDVTSPNEDSTVYNISMAAVTAGMTRFSGGAWAKMGAWGANGIEFFPNCYACEGVFQGEYALWNPLANTTQEYSGKFFNGFGDTLAATGEMVWVERNDNYPGEPTDGPFPPPNVVRYSPSGSPNDPTAGIIFSDSNILNVGKAYWVQGGQAVLVVAPSDQHWVLVSRDGSRREMPHQLGTYFIAGTPTGWLFEAGNEEGSYEFYSYNADTDTTTLVGGYGGQDRPIVVSNPQMGTNPARVTGLFGLLPPGIGPGSAATPAPQCTGFMPSRLVVGQQGRVTPGISNRIRNQPGLSSTILGQMPAGAVFDVLEGPVCDAAGIAWWRVRFGAVEGWTAEGQGSDYFTEPMTPGAHG